MQLFQKSEAGPTFLLVEPIHFRPGQESRYAVNERQLVCDAPASGAYGLRDVKPARYC
jgi:hypothetical protein